ncbi:hypothetical protein CLV51_1011041 [Chitinophaga niastensis]|uniref:Uncharacterized protein n=1 Tax=Chitinophaga niastensis TaxID=536980 RepID=A0A2P8HU03_CHINA|nr:hypothetical protein CLV51_1011041 [Chitinophaga niastensis]
MHSIHFLFMNLVILTALHVIQVVDFLLMTNFKPDFNHIGLRV